MAGGSIPVASPDEVTLTQGAGVLAAKAGGIGPSHAAQALKRRPYLGSSAHHSALTETIYAPLSGLIPNGGGSTIEAENRCRMAENGQFGNAALVAVGPLAAGHAIVVTLMKGGVATTMVATIDENTVANEVRTFSNLQTFTGADKLCLRIAYTGNGNGANKGFGWSLPTEPT